MNAVVVMIDSTSAVGYVKQMAWSDVTSRMLGKKRGSNSSNGIRNSTWRVRLSSDAFSGWPVDWK